MHRPLVATLTLAIVGAAAPAVLAAPCAPAAVVSGDPDTVKAISDLLAARGIGGDDARCPALHAHAERRGDAIVVTREGSDGAGVALVLAEPATAATVIESWARSDLEAPLLAARPVAFAATPLEFDDAIDTVPAPARVSERGVQLFATAETTLASDRTTWAGAEIGACVMLGPVCGAARLRVASVIGGPDEWSRGLERRGTEVLVGADVPLRLGRLTFSPGIATGVGTEHTHVDNAGWHMGSETGGLRADAHAVVSIPLGSRLALDLTAAIELTEATHVESTSPMPLPDEPLLFAHVGLGLRYGGL